jgi:hypothetical protein
MRRAGLCEVLVAEGWFSLRLWRILLRRIPMMNPPQVTHGRLKLEPSLVYANP